MIKPPTLPTSDSDRRRSLVGALLVAGLILGAVAFLWATLIENKAPAGISPTTLYATEFRDVDGKRVTLGQWQDKVLLINFWATWCAPCRDEIPDLVETQKRFAGSGVQVIGIAVDTPDKVKPFLRELAMNYPVLLDEDRGIELSKRLGNRPGVLPFSAMIDREGRLTSTTIGTLSNKEIEEQLRKLNINPAAL